MNYCHKNSINQANYQIKERIGSVLIKRLEDGPTFEQIECFYLLG